MVLTPAEHSEEPAEAYSCRRKRKPAFTELEPSIMSGEHARPLFQNRTLVLSSRTTHHASLSKTVPDWPAMVIFTFSSSLGEMKAG